MRKQIKTKEMYVLEVQSLTDRLNRALSEDSRLRDEFSMILDGGSYTVSNMLGENRRKRMSWEEIFFRAGELKSDAEYSCLLERWRTCRAELDAIKEAGVKSNKGE